MGRGTGCAADQFTDIMGTRRGLRPDEESFNEERLEDLASAYQPTKLQKAYVARKIAEGEVAVPLVVALGSELGEDVIYLRGAFADGRRSEHYVFVFRDGAAFEVGTPGEDIFTSEEGDVALAAALLDPYTPDEA